MIFSYNRKKARAKPDESAEHDFENDWMRNKGKMAEDVRKKTKRGDYSGAKETILVIEKLDKIMKGDKDEKKEN